MTIPLVFDNIDWEDPAVVKALQQYRETIDSSSPLVKGLDKVFTSAERKSRQEAFWATLEKFRKQ